MLYEKKDTLTVAFGLGLVVAGLVYGGLQAFAKTDTPGETPEQAIEMRFQACMASVEDRIARHPFMKDFQGEKRANAVRFFSGACKMDRRVRLQELRDQQS